MSTLAKEIFIRKEKYVNVCRRRVAVVVGRSRSKKFKHQIKQTSYINIISAHKMEYRKGFAFWLDAYSMHSATSELCVLVHRATASMRETILYQLTAQNKTKKRIKEK